MGSSLIVKTSRKAFPGTKVCQEFWHLKESLSAQLHKSSTYIIIVFLDPVINEAVTHVEQDEWIIRIPRIFRKTFRSDRPIDLWITSLTINDSFT
jgi:hypothetical protein